MLLEQLTKGIETQDVGEMCEIARDFAAFCPEACFLALHGDLGSGKTTFVKGLGGAWGVNDVKSPSFNIVNCHIAQRRLAHVDAYRLDCGQLDDFCLEEFLIPPFCLVIEWPEKIGTLIEFNFHLYFSVVGKCHRVQLMLCPQNGNSKCESCMVEKSSSPIQA